MKVITIGEILVEIMRKEVDSPLDKPDVFIGPFPSGAPAIFIDAVSRLGSQAGIVGGIGDDEFGNCLRRRLEADGVDTSGIKVGGGLSTGVAFVSYFSDGSRKFLYHMGNSAAGIIDEGDVRRDYISQGSVLHINGSSLAMGEKMRLACYKAVEYAKDEGLEVSFDPNLRTELLGVEKTREICAPVLNACDLLIPGADELQGITGVGSEKSAIEVMLEKGVKFVAVKDGSSGCRLYENSSVYVGDPFDVEEVDPTGAGDAFSAAIVVGWKEGMKTDELAKFANTVGALAVTEKGPMEGIPKRIEIDRLLETNED